MREDLALCPPVQQAQPAEAVPAVDPQPPAIDRPAPRLRPINRDLCSALTLDQLLPQDDLARLVWAYVKQIDLSPFYATIAAVEGSVGRDATDPALLVALWFYATLDGVTSARRLAQLCRGYLPYQWLLGGVSLNYHTLADFRVDHCVLLDDLLTDSIACFEKEGLITLDRTAQDGLKVRASAGECSFRREASLKEALAKAQEYMRQIQPPEDDPAGKRKGAARKRAAREHVKRLQSAVDNLQEIKQQREERNRKDEKQAEPRASTTDAQARKMKMPDGGYRPAYNVQFNTETKSGLIVGVAVSTAGNDTNEMMPMLDQMQERYQKTPNQHLVDGGYSTKDQIDEAATKYNTTVYAPLKDEQKQLEQGKDPYKAKRGDKPAVAAWRQRMATPEAKQVYKERASTAECSNAQARNRGLYQLKVRGKQKALAVMLWYALAHNLKRVLTLRAAQGKAGDGVCR
jgi:transposase